ncbi:MAG: hypothetical protein ACOC8D_02085 [bacterium]
MAEPSEETVEEQLEQQGGRRGGCGRCCLMSCLGIVVLGVVTIVAGAILVPRYARSLRETYAAKEPMALPEVEATDAEVAAIRQRIERFQKALADPDQAGTLVLTAEDLNKLVARDPELRESPFRPYFTIEEDRVAAQFVIPVDEAARREATRDLAERFGFQGRYFNVKTFLRLSLKDGRLAVRLDDITASGKPVPRYVAAWVRRENLGEHMLAQNPDLQKALQKLESIEVKDGRIIIKGKQGAAPAPATQAEPQAATEAAPEPRPATGQGAAKGEAR